MSTTKANRPREVSTFSCRRVSYLQVKEGARRLHRITRVQSLAQNFFVIATGMFGW